jgi:hypothetical protein
MTTPHVATIKLCRDDAMIEFEEGRLPEAEARLSELIDTLHLPQTPMLKAELCHCLIDRAMVRRWANRWHEALSDLAACEVLASTLSAFGKSTVLYKIHHTRAAVLILPCTTVYNREAARVSLAELRRLGFNDFGVGALEADLAFIDEKWAQAAELYQQVAQELAAQGWQSGVMRCRLRVGLAYLALGDLPHAHTEIAATLAFFTQSGPPSQLAAAQMAQARLQFAYGHHDEAWDLAVRAIAGIETLIRSFRDLFDQQRFIFDKLDYYYWAFDIGFGKGGRQGLLRAWTIAERAKSFYLCTLVANADVRLFDGVDPDQIAQFHALELEIDDLEHTLGWLEESRVDSVREAALKQKIQLISIARRELLEKLMRANPRWAALRTPPPFDLEAQLEHIDPAWMLVSYFWRPRPEGATLSIFYTGRNRAPQCVQTAWSERELAQLDASRQQLWGDVSPRIPLFPPYAIERVLPSALVGAFEPGQHILMSPHDHLRAIPLHALPYSSGKRLIDDYPVQYIPTLALLPFHKTVARTGHVLVLGCEQDGFASPPLKEVPAEISALEQLWSAKRPGKVTRRLIAPDGSPTAAGLPPNQWEHFEFLHIACHGDFAEDRPLDAALRLGRDALRTTEFFAVRLNAALISLSACALGGQARRDTGVELRGDEWVGLYIPLFYAGAQTLLVSLWNANSQVAALFMKALHTALSEGESSAKAFQLAHKSISTKPASLWANWYLVGFPDRLT